MESGTRAMAENRIRRAIEYRSASTVALLHFHVAKSRRVLRVGGSKRLGLPYPHRYRRECLIFDTLAKGAPRRFGELS